MNLNSNNKRHFEPDVFSPFNPIKKVRLFDGREKLTFTAGTTYQSNTNIPSTNSIQTFTDHRPKYKVHHKCKENANEKFNQTFKAKPMPNFNNPFVPQHYKSMTTTFQEFNLSCSQNSKKKSTSVTRCDTPESLMFSSFWSEKLKNSSPAKSNFKARPMPNFSQPFFPVLSRSINSPSQKGIDNKNNARRNENSMDIDQDHNMELDEDL